MRALTVALLFLFISFSVSAQTYPLEVEVYQVHSTTEGLAELDGMTTYRFYITNLGPTDFISSIYGNDQDPFELSAPDGIFNSAFNSSWSASGISPTFVGLFPVMEFDSYATIGLITSASTSGIVDAADPSIVEDPSQQITPIFLIDGSTGVLVNSVIGMAYYILNGNPVGLPDGTGRVMIMQITTSGSISGTLNAQIFPNGNGSEFLTDAYMFDGVGLYAADGACLADTDGDGICDEDEIPGCTDMAVCNYDPAATDNDGSCGVLDACGVCLGDDSTCTGCTDSVACNYDPDAIVTDNTICEYETCAGCMDDTACNYDPTATLEDGSCSDIDQCGICGGDSLSCVGCIFEIACNYNPEATIDDGSCVFLCPGCTDSESCNFDPYAIQENGSCLYPIDIYGNTNLDCYGNCLNDSDGDGICSEDEVLGCVDTQACNYNESATEGDESCVFSTGCDFCYNGEIINGDTDSDGVCNENEIVGCTEPQACNYNEQATDSDSSCIFNTDLYPLGYLDCDGDCINDSDGDGVCDEAEVSGCIDQDSCNFNPIATDNDNSCEYLSCAGCIYEYACNYDSEATISNGECDFGTCPGCTDFAACNYNPTVSDDDGSCQYLDALGVCGGSCVQDADANGVCDCIEEDDLDSDGICDNIDDCVGTYDECGVCNGPGLIYECGCSDIPQSDCDCNGNQLDVLGVCGGDCETDINSNGICDNDEAPEGCTYETALNFNPIATIEDGSCLFGEYVGCGEGTFWNEEIGICEVLYPGDSNFDNCIDLQDLLDLMANYGICISLDD